MIKPKIFFLYLTARTKMLEDYKVGKEPTTFLYGLAELRKMGFVADFSDLAFSHFNILRLILQPLEKLHSWFLRYSLGFRFHQALLLWPLYRNYDVLICTQDSIGLPIAFLKRIGLIKSKVIYVSSNLTNVLVNPRFPQFLKFIKKNLQATEAIVCSSKKEKELLEKFLKRKVHFLADGIDTDFFVPKKTKSTIDILSVGKDPFRDYKTFFRAIKDLHLKISVVCNPENVKGFKIPNNTMLYSNISFRELRELYWKTKVVVLPMKETNKPQGHTVLLTAMAMGKKIIASDVPGITTSYDLKKYPGITLVKPENSQELTHEIAKKLKENAKNYFSKKFNQTISIKTYSKKIAQLISTL